MVSDFLTISGGASSVLSSRALRGGLRVGSAAADRDQPLLRLEHVAVAGDDQRGFASATASMASSRRSMRSVRQSLASSTAERSRLP